MTTAQATTPEPTMKLGDAPKTLWVGLIFGLAAFIVNISFSSTSTTNGVMTSCSYFDAFALVAAVVCLGCGISSVKKKIQHPYWYPFATWLLYLLSGVLVLLSVIHALRAFGIIGGIC